MQNLLLAIDVEDDVTPTIAKAQRWANDGEVSTYAVRVIYEGIADLKSRHLDESESLRRFIIEAEAPMLKDWTADASTQPVECLTVWNKSKWQGVLDVAETVDAEIIIKQIHGSESSHSLRTPDDWNLIRHSRVPVLLSQSAWPKAPTLVAAIDAFDPNHRELNQRVLQQAKQLSDQLNVSLNIVTVFPMVSNWLDQVTSAQSYVNLRAEIDAEAKELVNEVCAACDVEAYKLTVSEGLAELEIERFARDAHILVIGTKARRGVAALALGNTAEKVLHDVNADVLAVP